MSGSFMQSVGETELEGAVRWSAADDRLHTTNSFLLIDVAK